MMTSTAWITGLRSARIISRQSHLMDPEEQDGEPGTTARRRAAHLKILLLHGDDDSQVPYETSIWYAEFLRTSGFSVDFRTFNRLQHFWTYREMDYVKQWLCPRIAVPRITVPRRHGRL